MAGAGAQGGPLLQPSGDARGRREHRRPIFRRVGGETRIAITHQNIRAINAIYSVIRLRVKAGASSHLDLAREQAQLEAVESQLSNLEIAQAQALHALAVLIGRPPEGFSVSSQSLSTSTPPALSPGLPSELLTRRSDIAEAEATLAAVHANLDAARAAFLPQISLTGSGGIASAALATLLSGQEPVMPYVGAARSK